MNEPQKTSDTHPFEAKTIPPGRKEAVTAALPPKVLEESRSESFPLVAIPRLVASDELFGAHRQLLIAHAGSVYRLQITKQGKLILTK